MFTGLIEATGRIDEIQMASAGRQLRISTSLGAELRPGDSVSTNGVCLTVTAVDAGWFSVDVSPETLRVTSLGALREGRPVNLERPLRADARVGGHFVLGHVDGVGRVRELRPQGDHYWMDVEFPTEFAPLLILKGSVTVDGISLTVASLTRSTFGVQIVPFTWAHTALAEIQVGDPVNLEGDVLGKYVVRFLEMQAANV